MDASKKCKKVDSSHCEMDGLGLAIIMVARRGVVIKVGDCSSGAQENG
jgi:hypothetical protein